MSDNAVLPDALVIRGRNFVRGGGWREAPTYAVIPPEVLFDETLNNCDLRVYCTLVYFRIPKGWTCEIGERRLAEAAGIDRRSLRKSIPKLIKPGHINRTVNGIDRSVYEIKNYLAGLRRKSKAEPIAAKKARVPVKLTCTACHRLVRGLGKSGVCRSCKTTANTERIAERVVRRVMNEKTA